MENLPKKHSHRLEEEIMAKDYKRLRTTTAMIIALLLGLFAYTIPLYAGNDTEYHMEEKTIIQIPVVGKITTSTNTYLAGCMLKETTSVKSHNPLIKTMTDTDGKISESQLTDFCEELQWTLDQKSGEFHKVSFEEIRGAERDYVEEDEVHIDMESDQNDMKDMPQMSHKILPGKKNINGYSCQEVLTQVYVEDLQRPIVIREFYTTDSKALAKITRAREKLHQELDYQEDHFHGVPELVQHIYESMQDDMEWERPDGEVLQFSVEMLDKSNDPIFSMTYQVVRAETSPYKAEHFTLN
jgi:hypothetical protein